MSDQDVHNFSTSSSSHRLPTLSASEALLSLSSAGLRAISTGLPKLDAGLQASQTGASLGNSLKGIPRGHVTEVYGPPASGKTCFAMQLASNALQAGDRVVWVDTASSLPGPRLKEILSGYRLPAEIESSSSPPTARTMDELLANLTHIQTPTLPHLLGLFIHPPPKFPPEKSSLVIIDSVSSLFAAAFPKTSDRRSQFPEGDKRKDNVQWAANRRWGVAGELLSKLGKMAATSNLAVLVINQTVTQLRGSAGAMLCCAISGSTWDAGIYHRIVLYRDLVRESESADASETRRLRFAAVLKAGGKTVDEVSAAEKVVPFVINTRGLKEVRMVSHEPPLSQVPALPQPPVMENRPKRKRDEIPDSEDEEDMLGSDGEFEWNDEDNALEMLEEEMASLTERNSI